MFKIFEKKIIVINEGINLNTDDDGINILPLRSKWPILPKIKKDRKGYYQQKDIKLKSKSLSTDRFQEYLKTIQEEDDTN